MGRCRSITIPSSWFLIKLLSSVHSCMPGAAAPPAEDRGAGEVHAVRAAPGAGGPRRPHTGLAGHRRGGRALGAGLRGGDRDRVPVLHFLLLHLAFPDAPPLRRQLRDVLLLLLLLGGREPGPRRRQHVRWYARLLRRAAGAGRGEYIPAEARGRGRGRGSRRWSCSCS
uniref:Uncharacterized protein n=1 Tax=Zea mays TaxID=4577 RepID=B4FYX4_MAIZE|nr:unknown [Zea mays]